MQYLDLHNQFPGKIIIIAPHMDDEVLACGGLIAKYPQKDQIHVIYATDGMKSPSPIIPGKDKISPELGEVRMLESKEAMKYLGVPEQNLHFLCLPEAQLQKNIPSLRDLLWGLINKLSPDHIFIPFRYDRHPDHLAVNQVIHSGLEKGIFHSQIIEYFVYYRWRLLPKGNIQKYIKPQFLYHLDISSVASIKRTALDQFVSQTTIYYNWQTRPILTSVLLDEECQTPEVFLMSDKFTSKTAVFTNSVLWIRLAHRLEPVLQKWKYLTGAFLKRVLLNRV